MVPLLQRSVPPETTALYRFYLPLIADFWGRILVRRHSNRDLLNPLALVLGAGASAPYRFPSGAGLMRLLTKGNVNVSEPWQSVISLGFHPDEIEAFRSGP